MNAIECEVHEPYNTETIKVTYHRSIRAALRYCKENGVSLCSIYREIP